MRIEHCLSQPPGSGMAHRIPRVTPFHPNVMFPAGNMWRIGNGVAMLMLLNHHIHCDVCAGFTNCLPNLTAHSIEDCNQSHSAR